MLSEGLASTALAGNPREWFNPVEEQQHRARWRMEHSADLSYLEYLALARAESTGTNGVSGTKLHHYQFAALPRKMENIPELQGLTASQLMTRLFPRARYIWLNAETESDRQFPFSSLR